MNVKLAAQVFSESVAASIEQLLCDKHPDFMNSEEKYFKEIIRQQNILKASMWQYIDSLHELTTSVNCILMNKVTNEVEEATTSFFTMFNFPLQDEEELIRVDEHPTTRKILTLP